MLLQQTNIGVHQHSRDSSPSHAHRPWTSCLGITHAPRSTLHVGVLPGEGVGPEVIAASLDVLAAVADASGLRLDVATGGPIGRDAERVDGEPLTKQVVEFCEGVFARGGAILNGPGGGRYVYDLRRRMDLFFKISPLQTFNGATDAARLRPEALRGIDILVTRENAGGAYQGTWRDRSGADGQRMAEHLVTYSHDQVHRFLSASARLARMRRGDLTVVWKEAGVPAISRLWRDCAEQAAASLNVKVRMVDVDLMSYRLVQEPAAFDVIAAPNLFGDVLADLGAVLLGSRGASYSGNFTARGEGVYQTNHGAAYDLAGTDRANPAGQIFATAMMLRESFACAREAEAIERALRAVWHDGWRTEDVAVPGARIVGTREIGRLVAERAATHLRHHVHAPRPTSMTPAESL